MKIQVNDRQGKGKELAAALKKQGASIVTSNPDIFLVDFDTAIPYYKKAVEKAYQQGAEVALFSHGAPVITAWDGIWKPCENVSLYLAQSPGEKEVMQSYGYPHPIEVIGWHYCAVKAFKHVKEIGSVLFAPWHPLSDGYLYKPAYNLNGEIFDKLSAMPYQLTVRYTGGDMRYSNIGSVAGVEYQRSDMTIQSSIKAIDKADVIVSNPGTFASLAVARGKPVVMYGQDIRPFDGYSDDTLRFVKNWDKYRDLMRYPYDISDPKPKASQHLVEYAAQHEAKEWREKFIGEALDTDRLYEVLTGLLEVSDDR